ncbi:MAG: hypothetical protein GXO62_05670 [Epsilonproteobacteria bacterium]|nr:hypothetical protein [Campylobacterota bacterium]
MKWLIVFLGTLLFALNPFEDIAATNAPLPVTNEANTTKQPKNEEFFDATFKSLTPKVKIALVADKEKFFKYLPSFINAINAYLISKGVEYDFKLYSLKDKIPEDVTDIILLAQNPVNSNARIYIPTIYKKGQNNIFYGGIDFKTQILKLSSFINSSKIYALNELNQISNLQFSIEKSFFPKIREFTFPQIKYYALNNAYVFFNTSAPKTAQILSRMTYLGIKPMLKLSTQINYDPLILDITQSQDTKRLFIANSIINPPLLIEDYALLINSDIKYNWLNYAGAVFANKIYNTQNGEDLYYMNDFHLYIFDNQINYGVKLYQIIRHSFQEIN